MIGYVQLPVGIAFGVVAVIFWHYFNKGHRWVPYFALIASMGIDSTFAQYLTGALNTVTGLIGGFGALICAIIMIHDFHWAKTGTKLTVLAAVLLPLLATTTGLLGELLQHLAHLANEGGAAAQQKVG